MLKAIIAFVSFFFLASSAYAVDALANPTSQFKFMCQLPTGEPCDTITSSSNLKQVSPDQKAVERPVQYQIFNEANFSPRLGTQPTDETGNPPNYSVPSVTYKSKTFYLRNYYSGTIYWRLFAKRGSVKWVWPSSSTYYYTYSGYTGYVTISCQSNESLYFGGSNGSGSLYWGVGLTWKYTKAAFSTCTNASYVLTAY